MTKNAKRIEQAKELLVMIGDVDHAYCYQLEELEARWFACQNNHIFESYGRSDYNPDINVLKVSGNKPDERSAYQDHLIPAVSRSRDALKAARPEGWVIRDTGIVNFGYECKKITLYNAGKPLKMIWGERLPTEELAEFHAIVQAWIYVWENET